MEVYSVEYTLDNNNVGFVVTDADKVFSLKPDIFHSFKMFNIVFCLSAEHDGVHVHAGGERGQRRQQAGEEGRLPRGSARQRHVQDQGQDH